MNLSNLPDSFYKLLVYIGIGLIVYVFINQQNESNQYDKELLVYNSKIRKINSERLFLKQELEDIFNEAEIHSKKNNEINPLKISDSGYVFNRTLRGEKVKVNLSDTISNLLKRYENKQKEFRLKDSDLDIQRYLLDEKAIIFSNNQDFLYMIAFVGAILLFIGLAFWIEFDIFKDKIIARQNLNLPTYSKNCQSCGIKFNSTTKFGTQNTSELNYNYCYDCYVDGKFTDETLTLDEMLKKINSEMKSSKISIIERLFVLSKIEKLDRWKKNKYF
jgi:hypothetical protein